MSSDALFGWDLTFKTVERDVKRKADIIIAFVHWNLTKRGFRNVGLGEERTLTGNEVKSELLPNQWNDKDNYTLRYLFEDKLFILHGLHTDGNLIVNLMRSEDLSVSNIAVKVDDTIKEMSGGIDKILPDHKEFMYQVKRDLIDTIVDKPSQTAETQTQICFTHPSQCSRFPPPQDYCENSLKEIDKWVRNRKTNSTIVLPNGWSLYSCSLLLHLWHPKADEQNRRPLQADPLREAPRPFPVQPDHHDLWDVPPAHLPNIGGADLNPFGAGGGGMLFHPYVPRRDLENPGLGIPGGLPRGAVPPGARFDPFGPPMPGPLPGAPMPGRRPPPDADHLPPPGGFNDYIM